MKDFDALQLGKKVGIPTSPDDAIIDVVPNPHPGSEYFVRFTCPEFTSLCPATGQPDFARIVIDYIPNASILESKSLKLYMSSFRNHKAFHEDCTVGIGKRLYSELDPVWLRIGGFWFPRGGIPIDVFYQEGLCPEDMWMRLPDQGVPPYGGR